MLNFIRRLFGPASPTCIEPHCTATAQYAARDGGSGGFCAAHRD